MKLKPGETVVFAWIAYKSRAHRDHVNAKVMKDKRLADMNDPKTWPFDGKRLIYGGFNILEEVYDTSGFEFERGEQSFLNRA